MDTKKKIEELSQLLLKHQYLYYVAATPEVSDLEYDKLFDQLLELEEKFPEFALPNSPSKRVGSDLDNTFPEKEHTTPVLSLDKEYNEEGLEKWLTKTIKNAQQDLSFVVEEKIDGASIVLYYKNNKLDAALTRGNGLVGNDVTDNVRTIHQVPLTIKEKGNLAVRGEIFINKSDFTTYNKTFDNRYSNPRNLASGSMRNIRSSQAAKVPLNIFAYEGFFDNADTNDHILTLSILREQGFKINTSMGFFSDNKQKLAQVNEKLPDIVSGDLSQLTAYVRSRMKERDNLDHEIDGLVIKVNELDVRESLGFTSHHPRWAIAFKFDAPTAQTRFLDARIQIGRNGRVTPVAILEPVRIAGSTVARATLHNLEYIQMLELGKDDQVSISKRGDVIPAVEEVLEKDPDNPSIFKFPTTCPFCESELQKDGAHHFCMNRYCPEREKRSIIHFAAKGQMDVDSLGDKTIAFLFEKGFVKTIPDLYTFDYDLLLNEEGFKEKKVQKIKDSLEASKKNPFARVLPALGLDGIGKSASRDLIANGFNRIDTIIEKARQKDVEAFSGIEGFGEITAQLLIQHFNDEETLNLVKRLKEIGLNFFQEVAKETTDQPSPFKDQVWVITGSFENFSPRSKAAQEIEARGGKTSGSISSKTTHLLAGASAGSKLEKAKKAGAQIISETQFIELLKGES